jgi:hypothetical protein
VSELSDELRELYRLSRPVRDATGRTVLEPIPDTLFDTWRAANMAARASSKAGSPVVTESILVDARGRVVFPPPATVKRCRTRWHVAPVLRFHKPTDEGKPTGSGSRRRRGPGNGKP